MRGTRNAVRGQPLRGFESHLHHHPEPAGHAAVCREFYVDTVDTVDKLDATGIRLVKRAAGVVLFSLEHTWSRADGRVHYVSVLEMGARARLAVPLNRYLNGRVMPRPMLEAWLRHNVEEVGQLEHILPGLYAEST